MKLEKSPIPKYYQLKDLLTRQILDGTFPVGSRIPTVNSIAAQYNVSRATANKAVIMLQDDGLLESTPGVGSVVRDWTGRTEDEPEPMQALLSRPATSGARWWKDALGDGKILYLGFQVAFSAKALLSGQFSASVIAGIEGALMDGSDNGNVIFHHTQYDLDFTWERIVRAIGDQRICGIVVNYAGADNTDLVTTAEFGSKVANLVRQAGLPLVVIGERTWGNDFSTVSVDEYDCIRLLMDHLVSLGHERILFLGADVGLPWIKQRTRAFLDFVELYQLPITADDVSMPKKMDTEKERPWCEVGYKAAMLKLPGDYTAVLAANDYMAWGAIEAARELGISAPECLSFAGIDNCPECRHLNITSVNVPWGDMGQMALELLARQRIGDRRIAHADVRPQLIVRSTTSRHKNINALVNNV